MQISPEELAAIIAVMTPIYYFLHRILQRLEKLSEVVTECKYCSASYQENERKKIKLI